MKPTNELRYLQFIGGKIQHPTAQLIAGTNLSIVLQQKWIEVYAFTGDRVPDGKEEWRDIPIEELKGE
jgi:hypothetical protein